MTRAELRERMSAHEFGQWVAIFLARPFDLHTLYELPQALIRATLIQLQGGKPKLDDLLWSKRSEAATLEGLAERFTGSE